jgi:hypothetical protein
VLLQALFLCGFGASIAKTITKYQDINQKEATEIRTRRHKNSKRYCKTCKIWDIGNMINYFYSGYEDIALYCGIEKALYRNTLKNDDTNVWWLATLHRTIMSRDMSKTLYDQVPESRKFNEFKQMYTKLSDII